MCQGRESIMEEEGTAGEHRGALPDLAILTMGGILDARPRVGYFYTGKSTLAEILG